jgi:hypothetical protein
MKNKLIKKIELVQKQTVNELWRDYKELFKANDISKLDIKLNPSDCFMGNTNEENAQFDLGYLSALKYIKSLI